MKKQFTWEDFDSLDLKTHGWMELTKDHLRFEVNGGRSKSSSSSSKSSGSSNISSSGSRSSGGSSTPKNSDSSIHG